MRFRRLYRSLLRSVSSRLPPSALTVAWRSCSSAAARTRTTPTRCSPPTRRAAPCSATPRRARSGRCPASSRPRRTPSPSPSATTSTSSTPPSTSPPAAAATTASTASSSAATAAPAATTTGTATALPPPPYVHEYNHHPYASATARAHVRAHALVGGAGAGGGSSISISKKTVGTHAFDVATSAWAEGWALPFSGRARYLPEHGLWFGLASSVRDGDDALLCASDLTVAPPTPIALWRDRTPADWTRRSSCLLHLGCSKFWLARFFEIELPPPEDFRSLKYVVFSGLEVERRGEELRVVKHMSEQYSLFHKLMHWVL